MVTLSRVVVQIRCSEEEKARWTKQAGTRTLTDYFKFLADSDEEGSFDSGDPDTRHEYKPIPLTPKPFRTDWKVPKAKKGKS